MTGDVVPSGGAKVFSIQGAKLGCEIDASSGEILIGDQAGTITLRVWAGKGTNFDEATLTIVALPPATAAPPAAKPTDTMGEATPEDPTE